MKKEEKKPHSWVITIAITTFVLSLFFSYISNTAIAGLNVLPGIFILMLVILIGVFFDLLGVAVTIAKEDEFHARASKKIKGSKTAIRLIRNSEKVSNVCADVIGDICRSYKWCNSCNDCFEAYRKLWNEYIFSICSKCNSSFTNSQWKGY